MRIPLIFYLSFRCRRQLSSLIRCTQTIQPKGNHKKTSTVPEDCRGGIHPWYHSACRIKITAARFLLSLVNSISVNVENPSQPTHNTFSGMLQGDVTMDTIPPFHPPAALCHDTAHVIYPIHCIFMLLMFYHVTVKRSSKNFFYAHYLTLT